MVFYPLPCHIDVFAIHVLI